MEEYFSKVSGCAGWGGREREMRDYTSKINNNNKGRLRIKKKQGKQTKEKDMNSKHQPNESH